MFWPKLKAIFHSVHTVQLTPPAMYWPNQPGKVMVVMINVTNTGYTKMLHKTAQRARGHQWLTLMC